MKKSEMEDLVSSLAIRLEREFIFRDFNKGEDDKENYVTSSCFVVPPARGEYYATNTSIYQVITVTHVFNSANAPGVIWVKKIKDIEV